MHTTEEGAGVSRVQAAVERGRWTEALDALHVIQGERALTSTELELFARAAYAAGDLEGSVEAWERVHSRHTADGNLAEAAVAATAVATYLMMDTGLMAPVRAWVNRAERLLFGQGECETHAWLAVVRVYERLMSGDVATARALVHEAVDIAARQAASAPGSLARVARARLAILDGDVAQGLDGLDDVAGDLLAGDVDPLTVGMVFCELICAMQGLAQYDRAEEWTAAMERWRRGVAFGGINGRCRVHRAEILRLRGSCHEAEDEALHACEELRPWMRREYGWPLTELGTIRLRKGDLAGAEEAFLAAYENGWDPEPGLALLRLAQGDATGALALITEALDHPAKVPSKERFPHGDLPRAPLLDAHVEIALAAGDSTSAHKAATELSDIAETFKSSALRACAALARARVALADATPEGALEDSLQAVHTWAEVGAPYETAVARLVLARAHEIAGDRQRALLEVRTAQQGFRRIGAALRLLQADAICRRLSPTADDSTSTARTDGARVAPGGAFSLDGDIRTISFDGHTAMVRDLKGMRYLAHLLGAPGREIHVLELAAAEAGGPLVPPRPESRDAASIAGEDAGPALDDHAKDAYRRRLQEIEEDIEEAERHADTERASLARVEHDYLVGELTRAFGLGGRPRRVASTSERARASVTRALRYALGRIAEHHPGFADHVRMHLRTGTYCGYFPDTRAPITWQL